MIIIHDFINFLYSHKFKLKSVLKDFTSEKLFNEKVNNDDDGYKLNKIDAQSSAFFPEKNVYFVDFREDKVAHNSSVSFWKGRPLRGNKALEIVRSGFPNETLRFRAAGDINLEGYKNASLNTRTLMDFNGPVIMEDMNDQNLASHIRVKRNEPIVHRRPSSVNLLPRNFQRKTDETSIFSDATSKVSRSEYENQSNTIVDTTVPQSRHKRGILSENGHHRKRVKGNIGHSKHNVETKNKNKKHKAQSALKSPNQLVTKKTKNPNLSMFSFISKIYQIIFISLKPSSTTHS